MQIPEIPENIITNYYINKQMAKLITYLKKCNFTVIRFIKNDDYIIKNCCDYKIHLGSAIHFNDKFDCCFKFPQEIEKTLKELGLYSSSLPQFFEEAMDTIKKNLYITCFTDKCNLDNSKMWYIYGDNYKGACIEYEISNIADLLINNMFIFLPVTYSNNPGNLKLEEKGSDYLNKNIYKSRFTKSTVWQDEKEWRLYMENHTQPNNLICKPKAIYLGAEMDDKKKKEIKNKLSSDVFLYETYFNYPNLKISYKLIENRG